MTINIRKPDDMHVHLREGQVLANVVPFTAAVFARAVVMGNLATPITTAEDVRRYRAEIKMQAPDFEPIMSVMLVNSSTPQTVRSAHQAGAKVLKLIPGNTSTNSTEGVPLAGLKGLYPVLKTAHELGVVFSGHWELALDPASGEKIPELERETAALPYLEELINDLPELKIVAEHVSTKAMVELVKQAPENVAATITVHHTLLTSEDVLSEDGKITNPHHFCKPIAKSEDDRKTVANAMVSGNPKFFFGSDSAPHPISKKRSENPPAGIFTAPVALPLLCKIFEEHGSLNRIESFVSVFGARFYGLELNQQRITLKRENWIVPDQYEDVKLFKGGERLRWQVV